MSSQKRKRKEGACSQNVSCILYLAQGRSTNVLYHEIVVRDDLWRRESWGFVLFARLWLVGHTSGSGCPCHTSDTSCSDGGCSASLGMCVRDGGSGLSMGVSVSKGSGVYSGLDGWTALLLQGGSARSMMWRWWPQGAIAVSVTCSDTTSNSPLLLLIL